MTTGHGQSSVTIGWAATYTGHQPRGAEDLGRGPGTVPNQRSDLGRISVSSLENSTWLAYFTPPVLRITCNHTLKGL